MNAEIIESSRVLNISENSGAMTQGSRGPYSVRILVESLVAISISLPPTPLLVPAGRPVPPSGIRTLGFPSMELIL